MKNQLLAVFLFLAGFLPLSFSQESSSSDIVAINSASDLLEWQFGLTFALAERLDRPEDARDAVNVFAFRYFLLCHGAKAILPPIPEIDQALRHQRSRRLKDDEIKKDPLDFQGTFGSEQVESFKKSGGRAYPISSFGDYERLVAAFHLWLKSLGTTDQ